MRTVTQTVYTFDELSDSAKERAREAHREGQLEYDWWDSSYDDFARVADILGIDLRQRAVKLMNGSTRYDPAIYFSGFASQGDGACFEGTYRYAKGSVKRIREYAPQDAELHAIADSLFDVQRRNRYQLTANIAHRGHYYHSGCMDIDVDAPGGTADVIKSAMRDFADWMYKRLEEEHDYQLSDESIEDSIKANECEFTESGDPA